MIRQSSAKKIFWIVLLTVFLLSGGQITATSANTTANDLIINEFMAANGTGLTDEDGDYSDWIEIYNRGDSAVNLGGWALTDDPNQPQQWPFPDMVLAGHDYLVVFASGKNRASTEPGTELHTNFKLGKSGDFLALHNILEGRFMDLISPEYPEQFRDVSYGRFGDDLNFGYLPAPSPGGPNEETLVQTGAVSAVVFSAERGFYESPFVVELTTDTSEATIRYTTDGSEPTESNGTIYSEPIPVQRTTLLRAAAFRPGYLPSTVTTHTYLFPEEVLAQFPTSDMAASDLQKGTKIIPAAAANSRKVERSVLKEGLKAAPSLSLVTDAQNVTDLYAPSGAKGKDSEHMISLELLYPDHSDKPGPQVNAGIRPFKQASEAAKQSFGIYFRGEYGATKFQYPLFPESQVESFDTLILQAVGGDSPASDGAQASNEWLRSSQIAMSGLGSHGIFVNLYLNGRYAGLYNLVEKPNADFMSSYLGGDKEDWFMADQAGPLDVIDQTGELNLLYTTLGLAPAVDSEFGQPEYLAETYAAAAAYLDPAQLIDYVLLNWYAASMGWPASSWYAAIRPQDLPGRGKLLIGEALPVPANEEDWQTGVGPSGSAQQNIHTALFGTLMENPDFKVKFADQLYQHLANEGALTDANAQNRWQALSNTVSQVILAESTLRSSPDRQPPPQGNDVLARMEGNAARLMAQAREAGYYPEFDPPLFSQNGGLVEAGFILKMSLPAETCLDCTIYYTTEGSDPRLPFTGEVIPVATAYDGPIALDGTLRVKARVWQDGTWSALHEATFSVVEQDNKIRITEIMYNPLAGDDYEFIELQNVGDSRVELAGISLDEGVRFTFPPDIAPLAPGEFAVLVSNPEIFAERYPNIDISGAYEGHLSNKGEQLILRDAEGQTLLDITYGDENGWPISADGRGDSLTLISHTGYPSDPKSWRASTTLDGSPGAADPKN